MGSPAAAMLELDGPQIKVLRIGLLSAFVGPDAFDVFLSDELDKRLNFYAGAGDPFPDCGLQAHRGRTGRRLDR